MALLPEDPEKQKKILVGLLPFIAVGAYYYFMHGKSVAEVTETQTRLEALEAANVQAQTQARMGGPDLEKRLATYEQHMIRLEQLIPSKEEVSVLLRDMTVRAQETGVEIVLIQPEAEEPGPYYTKQIYELQVKGAYHDVGQFLSAIGSMPRIITPTALDLKTDNQNDRAGRRLLNAGFRIETYVLPEPGPTPPPAQATANATT